MAYQPPPYPPPSPIEPGDDGYEPPASAAHAKPRSWKRTWALGAVGAVVVAAGLGAIAMLMGPVQPAAPATSPLRAAQKQCDPANLGTLVADGDKTLIVDSTGKEDSSGVDLASLACILHSLGTTAAAVQHIDSTRALDGRQTDAWPGYSASWSYHPDQGLDMIITAT